MPKTSAFVARSFDPSDNAKIDPILKFLESFQSNGFICETAERAEVESVSEKVRNLIDRCPVFVGILTKRYAVYDISPAWSAAIGVLRGRLTPRTWIAPPWVIQESGYAVKGDKKLILFLEAGVELSGLQGDLEYIPYDPQSPTSAFQRASEMINGLLAAAAGVLIETTVVHNVAQKEQAVAEAKTGRDEEKREPATFLDFFANMVGAIDERDWKRAEEAYNRAHDLAQQQKPEVVVFLDARYAGELFIAGQSEALDRLKSIATAHPDDPVPLEQLAHCFLAFKQYDDASEHFERAANLANGEDAESYEIAAADALRLNKQFVESKQILVTLLQCRKPEKMKTRFDILRALHETLKDSGEEYPAVAIAELALHENPAESRLRFPLALEYDKLKYFELSLHHDKVICEHEPKDYGALNNLGVAYSNCGLSIHSAAQYKKSFQLGNTLAASNLGYKYLASGLADEATKLLREAQAMEGCVPQVDQCLAAVTERQTKERDDESAKLEMAREHQNFLLSYAAAFLSADTPALDGIWSFSFGDISLKLSGSNLMGSTERVVELQPLNALAGIGALGGSREPSKQIERFRFQGIVRGRTCKFEVEKERSPQTAILASLLTSSKIILEGYIVFAADGNSGKVAELSDGKPKDYFAIQKPHPQTLGRKVGGEI